MAGFFPPKYVFVFTAYLQCGGSRNKQDTVLSVKNDSLATEGPLSLWGAVRKNSKAGVDAPWTSKGDTNQERCSGVGPNFSHNYT